MNKKTICIAALLISMACLGSCKAGKKEAAETNVQTESSIAEKQVLTTDSIKFSEAGKGYECKMTIDFPKGEGKLEEGIRDFLLTALSDMNGCDSPDKPKAEYKGDKKDGKAMVSFFGKQQSERLKKEYNSILEYREGEDTPAPLSFEGSIRLEDNATKYVTYDIASYVYLGGAHGSSMSRKVNIIKETGRVLETSVDTTKTKELQPLLRRGVIDYFKECGEEISDDNLNDMLFVDNGIIPLPACTPALTGQGLKFIYQQYEIGPYALGMVSFTVSYDKIKKFMTEEAAKLIE